MQAHPLSGATVNEKGTNNAVVTDATGAFSIRVGNNATLVISFAGFDQQELTPTGTDAIAITLSPNNATLYEVVVTGFGTEGKHVNYLTRYRK